jgi:threonine dehydrogenase-like Zn-dependent dehydrogenase
MTMRALRVIPGKADSAVLDEIDDPPASDGSVLVSTVAVGICGTDFEIVEGLYGWAPAGRDKLVIGHEAVGRVVEAPDDSGFSAGDIVVPIVRRPDPVPCRYCAAGEWDMCVNGRYTERGIKELDGYASERFRIGPEFLVPVPAQLDRLAVLVEPTSVVAKAWDHIDRIGGRSRAWQPSRVLITGAGPIGLLAALLASQRGAEVHVLDRVAAGPKPELVKDLGGTYHCGDLSALREPPDVIIECTGAPTVLGDVIRRAGPSGIVCLTGVSVSGKRSPVDVGEANRRMVLQNDVVFGTVNANRRHYAAAVEALSKADPNWLARLVTRRVPVAQWRDAFTRHPDDVKTVLEF